jgi:hypothetical protein
MGRGDRQKQLELQRQELDFLKGLTQKETTAREQERASLVPQFEGILSQPGYTPEQQAAIRGAALESLGGVFDTLQQTARSRVARTGNAAGFNEMLEELGREQARNVSRATREIEGSFADVALQERDKALEGLARLFGVDTGMLGSLLGSRLGVLNLGAQLAGKGGGVLERALGGFFGGLGSSLGRLF